VDLIRYLDRGLSLSARIWTSRAEPVQLVGRVATVPTSLSDITTDEKRLTPHA